MFETLFTIVTVVIVLGAVTYLSALYINRYQSIDAIIAVYAVFILLAQLFATKIVVYDFGLVMFTTTLGTLLFPFTFQITDMVNEAFGPRHVQRMILIVLVTQVIVAVFFFLSTLFPGLNDLPAEDSWQFIFGLSIRITIASWIAFFVSENLDALLYDRIRTLLAGRHLWVRNAGSDVISLAIDSFIFVPLAFVGVVPLELLVAMITGQIAMKWLLGLIDTPFIYWYRHELKVSRPLVTPDSN